MSPSIDSDPFVGRESEIAELTVALDEALSGRGGFAIVAGEPGIGKTSLLEAFEDVAADNGATVLWGRGGPEYPLVTETALSMAH